MVDEPAVMRGSGGRADWPAVFDEYGVQFLALDVRADSELVQVFRPHPGWRVCFEGEEAVLFGRVGPSRAGPSRGGPAKSEPDPEERG